MTVDPFGMDTGSPLTVTSILSEAGAACCCADVLVCRHLSEVLTQGASDLQARRLCAACDTRPSTMAALPWTMRFRLGQECASLAKVWVPRWRPCGNAGSFPTSQFQETLQSHRHARQQFRSDIPSVPAKLATVAQFTHSLAYNLACSGRKSLNCFRSVSLESFPVAVCGSSSTNATFSGIHHFATFPCAITPLSFSPAPHSIGITLKVLLSWWSNMAHSYVTRTSLQGSLHESNVCMHEMCEKLQAMLLPSRSAAAHPCWACSWGVTPQQAMAAPSISCPGCQSRPPLSPVQARSALRMSMPKAGVPLASQSTNYLKQHVTFHQRQYQRQWLGHPLNLTSEATVQAPTNAFNVKRATMVRPLKHDQDRRAFGCAMTAFSMSMLEIHSPPDLMTSLERSVMAMWPSASMVATSPVMNQSSLSVAGLPSCCGHAVQVPTRQDIPRMGTCRIENGRCQALRYISMPLTSEQLPRYSRIIFVGHQRDAWMHANASQFAAYSAAAQLLYCYCASCLGGLTRK